MNEKKQTMILLTTLFLMVSMLILYPVLKISATLPKLTSMLHEEIEICPDIPQLGPLLNIQRILVKIIYFGTLHG